MSRYIWKSVLLLTLSIVICYGLYPRSSWVIGQAIFSFQANSSMLTGVDSKVVGSRQIAQPFTKDKDEYPPPRQSAASYDASAQNPDFGGGETPLLQRPAETVCLFYDC
jgi:potassium-transporting ATPase KdpC subunit